MSVADPVFPRGGGVILAILSRKLHEIEKKFDQEGARVPEYATASNFS